METSSEGPRETRRATFIAWIAILAVVGFVAWHVATTSDPAQTAAAVERRARSLLGSRELHGPKGVDTARIDALDRGDPSLRQRAAVLAGELIGLSDAHRRLVRFDTEARAAGADVAELQRVFLTLYPDPLPPEETQAERVTRLDAADRDRVAALGWSGRLALAPDGMPDPAPRAELLASARRASIATTAFGVALLVGLLAGCAVLVVLIVMFATGRFKFGLEVEPGSRSFAAEMFALWIVLHVALGNVVDAVSGERPAWIGLLLVDAITPVALFLPRIRGLSWCETRRYFGLHAGRGVLTETACGVLGWFASLPFVAAGFAVTYFLMRRAGGGQVLPGVGSHPATAWVQSASTAEFGALFLLACVITPVIEETMFRGALYGHLRERTSRLSRVASVALSAVVVSLLFASVHPQGWMAIPGLAASALTFTFAREWRGSLIASMTMHGMTNAVAFLAIRLAVAG